MQPTQDALVFIVDDDAGVREALAWLLRSRRLPSQSFESADAFAEFIHKADDVWRPSQPDACCLMCAWRA
jgi:two-component system response regulator DctR